jgi:hypothetical protein
MFDADILETTHEITSLIQSGAPFYKLDQAQVKLSILMEDKRKSLYNSKDPSYYVDQLFRSTTKASRRERAAGLAEQTLGVFNCAIEGAVADDDISNLDTIATLVEFFRFFSRGRTVNQEPDADIADNNVFYIPSLPDVEVQWNQQYKISFDRLAEGLVKLHYISEENARYLSNRLLGLPLLVDEPPQVEWLGDSYSLATLLGVADRLGAITIEPKKDKQDKGKNSDGKATARAAKPKYSPSILAYILHGFELKSPEDPSTTYRHTEVVLNQLECFIKDVNRERKARWVNTPARYRALSAWKDVLSEYFANIHEFGDRKARVLKDSSKLKRDILELFNTLLNEEAERDTISQ